MDFPREIDLYDWTEYAIFRVLTNKPFPSPRVWDNAGTMGFTGGNYRKDKFFDKEIFTYVITSNTRDKYGGEIRRKNTLNVDGYIRKADGHAHTFFENKISTCHLNFENFLVAQKISFEFDYQQLRDTIREIYYLVRIGTPSIDTGYIAPTGALKYNEYPSYDESKWIKLNKAFASELNNKNHIGVDFIYENVSSIFSCSIDKLSQISKGLNNELWFTDMFNFSFRERFLKNIYSLDEEEVTNNSNNKEAKVEIIKSGEIEVVNADIQETQKRNSTLDDLYKNDNQNKLKFIPSEAKIPIGFKSFGDKIKDLEFALQNPSISFRSFLIDCEYIKDGNWIEETLYCKAFDEGLYCQLIREYHRYSIAELNSMKAEEMKKAERKGAGIGGLFGLLTGGLMAPITAAMGANVGKMISNNVDERKPLKDFLPEPGLVFLKDQGSYLSLKKTYAGANTKRRICLKQNSLNNENIYFDLIPMIVFDNWVTPAQIFKLENDYYFRPISANYDINNEFNLQYNPIKYRRSYSYDPRPQKDIEKLANIKVKTRIVGETIEKTPTIFHAWLRDDESFQHFYFDYSTDGTIF